MKIPLRPALAMLVVLISFIGCTTSDGFVLSNIDDPASIGDPNSTDPNVSGEGADDPSFGIIDSPPSEFRAVWVATVLNLDFPSREGISAAAMKREIDAIVATTVDLGLNAVVFQVRPTGDAFYESDIFPWSRWLSGEQGQGIDGFDPLAYWLEACHGAGIEFHAWLNPYRIIHTSSNTSDPETLAANNPVRLRPELAVAWQTSGGNKGLFLDPGLPEARQLILDGIKELIEKYDVDGIHIDDYFYPGRDFNDAASYEIYGDAYGEGMELDDWRRENVNEMVRGIQSTIIEHNEAHGKNVRWGISPTAIWKNGSSDPLGIPTTAGMESYHALYADTRRWVTEEWVDYICPQIYWYIGYDIADFEAILTWWSDLCAETSVDLYIGHATYREQEDDQTPRWQGEMTRQLEMLAENDIVKGSVFYRYFSLRSDAGQSIRSFYAEKDGFPQREPIITPESLSIGFPSKDDTVTGTPSNISGYNILGTSLPDKPLYLNGEEVTTRTAEGFFHVFPPLSDGDNVFTFSQDGEEDVTRIITLRAPSGGGADTPTPTPSITNVTVLDYATVTSDEAWVYATNSTSDGIGFMLTPGMRDRVVAKSGDNLLKLSSGVWIRNDAVTVKRENAAIADVLGDGVYRSGQDYDVIAWSGSVFPAVAATYDGSKLVVSFGMHQSVPALELPDDESILAAETLFSDYRSGVNNSVPFYEFTLKEDARFEGYYIDYEDGELRLYLKKRKALSDGDMPLTGIAIMLDPGHGGDSHGTAAGPLGTALPEKELVFINTLKLAERLERLGATVILTRDSDAEVTPQERFNMSRQAIPDIFISLHVNSVAETTNAASIRGFSVWYQNENSTDLTEAVRDVMQYINPGTNRSRVINQSNFYVCRPWWSPHILLESSFIMNLDDFVWLIDPVQQDRMADATVDAILDYFS